MGACAAKLNETIIPQAIDQPKIDAAVKKEKVLRAIEAEKQVAAWKKLLEDPAAAAAYNKSLLTPPAEAAPAAAAPAAEGEKKEGDAAAADKPAEAKPAEEVKPPESGVWIRAESLKGTDGDAASDVTLTKETSDKDITKYAVQFVTNAKWRATFKSEYWNNTGKAAANEKLGKIPGGAGEKLMPEVEKKANEAVDKGVADFAKALVEAAEKGEPLATDAEKAEATAAPAAAEGEKKEGDAAAAPAADKPAEAKAEEPKA